MRDNKYSSYSAYISYINEKREIWDCNLNFETHSSKLSSEDQIKQTKLSQQYQEKYITFMGFLMNKEPENNIEIIGKYEIYLKFSEIFDDTWTFFIEEYSHVFAILFWLVLYLVAPIVLFKIVFLGRALLTVYTIFSSIGGHARILGGYRNFDTPDNSYNNLLLHYVSLLMFPTILQNNHHGAKYTLEKGSGIYWYEYDASKHIARFLKLCMEKK
jgi:fatty-acid desaturase